MKIKSILVGLMFLLTGQAMALRPVESLTLGNFSEDYAEDKSDPLEYVFNRELNLKENKNLDDFKKDLAIYRGFYEEGKNLVNSCKEKNSIRYETEWDKQQALRTILAEIQYIGLDITARALPKYAKYFDYSEEDFKNLVNNLVGNSCSQNISVISLKELKNNMLLKFTKDNNFKLPTVKDNPLFPDNIDRYISERKSREHEFKMTIKLFQSICSWGGDPYNPVLLVPIIKHPVVMAFINRQLNFKGIDWNPKKNQLALIDSNQTVQVSCDNLICRKTNYPEFKSKVPISSGGSNFYQDFKNLYCDYFQLTDYITNGADPRIKKWMNEVTFDEENLINSQFISLITGYPDFIIGLDKYSDAQDLIRSSVDYTWNLWSKNQANSFSRELFFEEPLTLELIDHKLYFNRAEGNLKVAFDVNLGEFDRVNQMIGKLKVGFRLSVNKSFLYYAKKTIDGIDYSMGKEKEDLINRMKAQIERDVNISKEKLIIPPWKGDLPKLIADVLIEEIQLTDISQFKQTETGVREIPIEIYYSPFALKYLNHQYNVKEKESKNN